MNDFKYSNYLKARDASWRVIAENNINSLPIDVFELARKMGIKVFTYSKGRRIMRIMQIARLKSKNDALYVRFLGRKYIFYDDTVENKGRIRFTIAHEIGHHVLEHIKIGSFFLPRCAERRRGKAAGVTEREANIFASRLLAPSIVLHHLNIDTPQEIAKLCEISNEAAEYRANRMKKLNKRDKFSTSRLEQRALSCFKEFIEKQKNN